MVKKSAATRFETDPPALSAVTIDRIRGYARRYVRAGGSIFPSSFINDMYEHIGNIVKDLDGTALAAFHQQLEQTHFSDPEDEGRISTAADSLVVENEDAAFLFGAFVGLEFAALTFGQVPALPSVTPRPRKGARRGGR